ncbi:MAG TPA: DUF4956 domain-containing protein [Ruminococcaceae bacterium]|nr:DUF4956 domain-containing protein [Oscillospiraceae bacterium]
MKGALTVLNNIFDNIFAAETAQTLELGSFLISIGAALVLGLISALFYTFRSTYSKGFVVTLATLPAVVAAIIMMVSGSLGASVAVAGTFSLVRFRSTPGTAKEIAAIFLAMASGLACGMGYPAYGAVFTVIMCIVNVIYSAVRFGEKKNIELRRTLSVTVPEDLNYGDIFDDIMNRYTSEWKLTKVKTTNLGSLNKLTYDIVFKENGSEKPMIDELRTRNGNLEIAVSRQTADPSAEL